MIAIALGLLFMPGTANSAETDAPKVVLQYGGMFDQLCSSETSYKIDPRWTQELQSRVPEFQREWDLEGHRSLETAVELVGKPFTHKEFDVTLSLCDFPSESTPLIINARYTMKSFIDHPLDDHVFLSTVFHEILHSYIDAYVPKETPLLTKYAKESEGVRGHLHLLALQKAVYLKLGWNDVLKDVIAKDNSLPRPDYKRAWEIINGRQGYESFVREIQGTKQQGSFHIDVSASYPASLYYLIDQMAHADSDPNDSTYYLQFWKAEFGLSPEESKMLETYARIKRHYAVDIDPRESDDESPFLTHISYNLEEKWPLPYSSSQTLDESWSKAAFLVSDDDIAQLRRIFDHFDAKFRPRWEKDSHLLQAALDEFRSKDWESKMSRHLESLARFFALDPNEPRHYVISFVWAPERKYTGGNSHARLIGRFAPVEIVPEEESTRKLPIVVHEIVHGLFASMDAKTRARFQSELLAINFDQGLSAYSDLDEAWATSLGNGLFMETYLPEIAKSERSWYAEPDVDRYAHAIDPINREFLKTGKTVLDGYAQRLLTALKNSPSRQDARRLDFNFQSFVFLISPKVDSADGPLRAAFHPHSVWTYSLEDREGVENARKLLSVHWATPAVIAVAPEELAKVDVPGLRLPLKKRLRIEERARKGPVAYISRSDRGRPYLLLVGTNDALAAGVSQLKDAVFPIDRPLIPLGGKVGK